MIYKEKSDMVGGSAKYFLSHKEKGPRRERSFASTFPSCFGCYSLKTWCLSSWWGPRGSERLSHLPLYPLESPFHLLWGKMNHCLFLHILVSAPLSPKTFVGHWAGRRWHFSPCTTLSVLLLLTNPLFLPPWVSFCIELSSFSLISSKWHWHTKGLGLKVGFFQLSTELETT